MSITLRRKRCLLLILLRMTTLGRQSCLTGYCAENDITEKEEIFDWVLC